MEELAELLKKIWSLQKEYNKIIRPDDKEEQRYLDGAIWGMEVLISNLETKQENTNKKK